MDPHFHDPHNLITLYSELYQIFNLLHRFKQYYHFKYIPQYNKHINMNNSQAGQDPSDDAFQELLARININITTILQAMHTLDSPVVKILLLFQQYYPQTDMIIPEDQLSLAQRQRRDVYRFLFPQSNVLTGSVNTTTDSATFDPSTHPQRYTPSHFIKPSAIFDTFPRAHSTSVTNDDDNNDGDIIIPTSGQPEPTTPLREIQLFQLSPSLYFQYFRLYDVISNNFSTTFFINEDPKRDKFPTLQENIQKSHLDRLLSPSQQDLFLNTSPISNDHMTLISDIMLKSIITDQDLDCIFIQQRTNPSISLPSGAPNSFLLLSSVLNRYYNLFRRIQAGISEFYDGFAHSKQSSNDTTPLETRDLIKKAYDAIVKDITEFLPLQQTQLTPHTRSITIIHQNYENLSFLKSVLFNLNSFFLPSNNDKTLNTAEKFNSISIEDNQRNISPYQHLIHHCLKNVFRHIIAESKAMYALLRIIPSVPHYTSLFSTPLYNYIKLFTITANSTLNISQIINIYSTYKPIVLPTNNHFAPTISMLDKDRAVVEEWISKHLPIILKFQQSNQAVYHFQTRQLDTKRRAFQQLYSWFRHIFETLNLASRFYLSHHNDMGDLTYRSTSTNLPPANSIDDGANIDLLLELLELEPNPGNNVSIIYYKNNFILESNVFISKEKYGLSVVCPGLFNLTDEDEIIAGKFPPESSDTIEAEKNAKRTTYQFLYASNILANLRISTQNMTQYLTILQNDYLSSIPQSLLSQSKAELMKLKNLSTNSQNVSPIAAQNDDNRYFFKLHHFLSRKLIPLCNVALYIFDTITMHYEKVVNSLKNVVDEYILNRKVLFTDNFYVSTDAILSEALLNGINLNNHDTSQNAHIFHYFHTFSNDPVKLPSPMNNTLQNKGPSLYEQFLSTNKNPKPSDDILRCRLNETGILSENSDSASHLVQNNNYMSDNTNYSHLTEEEQFQLVLRRSINEANQSSNSIPASSSRSLQTYPTMQFASTDTYSKNISSNTPTAATTTMVIPKAQASINEIKARLSTVQRFRYEDVPEFQVPTTEEFERFILADHFGTATIFDDITARGSRLNIGVNAGKTTSAVNGSNNTTQYSLKMTPYINHKKLEGEFYQHYQFSNDINMLYNVNKNVRKYGTAATIEDVNENDDENPDEHNLYTALHDLEAIMSTNNINAYKDVNFSYLQFGNIPFHPRNGIPFKLFSNLYPFQLSSIDFIVKRHGRGLIADEMGCGKTIQALGLMAVYRDEWPVLIVTPPTLRLNWVKEILTWLPEFVRPEDILSIESEKCGYPNNNTHCPLVITKLY